MVWDGMGFVWDICDMAFFHHIYVLHSSLELESNCKIRVHRWNDTIDPLL